MAKFFDWKNRKRWTSVLCAALSVTFTLGIVSACAETVESGDNPSTSTPTPTDVQNPKNGNFEFFSERNTEFKDKHDFINDPSGYDWSYSYSVTNKAASGIVKTDEWAELATSRNRLVPESDRYVKASDSDAYRDDDGFKLDAPAEEGGKRVEVTISSSNHPTLTDETKQHALDVWDDTSIRDRIEFYYYYGIDSADEFEKYETDHYTIDFEDIKELADFAEGPGLYRTPGEDEDKPETAVLMIHNRYDADDNYGNSQRYTSSTVTLSAGTAAVFTVWVKTANLVHFENDPVDKRAGAYIGVKQTVGGTTLDDTQIKNIVTEKYGDELDGTNGWKQFTVYLRANTFASTTFRVELGLGLGSSTQRTEFVDGFAFFDDLKCKIISDSEYRTLTEGLAENVTCGLNDEGEDKKFSVTNKQTGALETGYDTFNIDLASIFDTFTDYNRDTEGTEYDKDFTVGDDDIRLTEDGDTHIVTSLDKGVGDNRNDSSYPAPRKSIVGKYSLTDLRDFTDNGYAKTILENDFQKFPFEQDGGADDDIIFILSTNGAAYTVQLPTWKVAPNSRELVSFFVKTSELRSGAYGAGAKLVETDSSTPSVISPFNSTLVATVDIDETEEESGKDIYDGWVQCFFFVENDTEDVKEYHLELTYGPHAISDTTEDDYCAGYAAFANFRVSKLTVKQYSYATTGTYAQKVSLTAETTSSTKFDDAAASGTSIEDGLATPANYKGKQAGSDRMVEGGTPNPTRSELEADGFYTGLLSKDYADKYAALDPAQNPWLNTIHATGADWWKTVFGDGTASNPAEQPLVIVNAGTKDMPSYGFTRSSSTTFGANTATRVTVRVKLSQNVKAYLYLVDVSEDDDALLSTNLPLSTFWYDDDGNLVNMDPDDDAFKTEGKVLFRKQDNGLFFKEGDTSGLYYANLSAFDADGDGVADTDDDGNIVRRDGTPAFYKHGDDFYAYYDKDTDTYTVKVLDLAKDAEALAARRYSFEATDRHEAVIEVDGAKFGQNGWVEASFYIQTGKEAKTYRLELWAGARDNTENGIPHGEYVFFDRVLTNSGYSDYQGLRDQFVDELKDAAGLTDDQKLTDHDAYKDLAQYYTYSFFDSPDYSRYDSTTDTDGDPWKNYDRTAYEEDLVYLFYEDVEGRSVSQFMSFAQNEVDVPKATTDTSDTDTTTPDTEDEDTGDDSTLWLSLVSILLVVALVVAIVAVLIRKYYKPKKKPASKKAAKRAPVKKAEPAEETPEPEQPAETPADENDPYNE